MSELVKIEAKVWVTFLCFNFFWFVSEAFGERPAAWCHYWAGEVHILVWLGQPFPFCVSTFAGRCHHEQVQKSVFWDRLGMCVIGRLSQVFIFSSFFTKKPPKNPQNTCWCDLVANANKEWLLGINKIAIQWERSWLVVCVQGVLEAVRRMWQNSSGDGSEWLGYKWFRRVNRSLWRLVCSRVSILWSKWGHVYQGRDNVIPIYGITLSHDSSWRHFCKTHLLKLRACSVGSELKEKRDWEPGLQAFAGILAHVCLGRSVGNKEGKFDRDRGGQIVGLLTGVMGMASKEGLRIWTSKSVNRCDGDRWWRLPFWDWLVAFEDGDTVSVKSSGKFTYRATRIRLRNIILSEGDRHRQLQAKCVIPFQWNSRRDKSNF